MPITGEAPVLCGMDIGAVTSQAGLRRWGTRKAFGERHFRKSGPLAGGVLLLPVSEDDELVVRGLLSIVGYHLLDNRQYVGGLQTFFSAYYGLSGGSPGMRIRGKSWI